MTRLGHLTRDFFVCGDYFFFKQHCSSQGLFSRATSGDTAPCSSDGFSPLVSVRTIMRHIGAISWALASIGIAACAPSNPVNPLLENNQVVPVPTPTPAPSPAPHTFVDRTVRVISGWDNAPVSGALVRVGEQAVTTDVSGYFTAGFSDDNLPIDIDAPGYLPRRTRELTGITAGAITLWPAANEAEQQAINAMAFYQNRLYKSDPEPGLEDKYFLSILPEPDGPTLEQALVPWRKQFEQISQLTNLRIDAASANRGEYCELVVDFTATSQSCPTPWGFCDEHSTDYYFTKPIHVVRERSDQPDVILRALVHTILYWPNPLPGLMNKTAPAMELSLLERQTLRMLTIRPTGTLWPDVDPKRE
jgi:hypothetical protein